MTSIGVTSGNSEDDQQIKWLPRMPWLVFLRGIFIASLFLFSSIFGIAVLFFSTRLLLKPFSERLFYRWCFFWANTWFKTFVFCQENINGQKIQYTGDYVPHKEFAIMISNHPSECDWLFFWSFSARKHLCSDYKIVLKKELSYFPGAGWAMFDLMFLFLGRQWETDKQQMRFMLHRYLQIYSVDNEVEHRDLLLLLFPEGTDFSPLKKKKAIEYAQQIGIKPFDYLLTPRVKGFQTAVTVLKPRLDAIYDLTIAYNDGVKPSIWSCLCGWFPKVQHLHLRRFSASQLPQNKEELKHWCYERFQEKDQLLSYFHKHQQFPTMSTSSLGNKDLLTQAGTINAAEWDRQPQNLTSCFIFWVAFTITVTYATFAFQWFLIFQVMGWTFFFLNSTVKSLQVWNGNAPSNDFIEKSRTEKMNKITTKIQ